MRNCAVATCKNTNRITRGSDIKYYRFPKDKGLLKQWMHACRRGDRINIKNARICSIHFHESSFEIPLRHKLLQYCPINSRYLKLDAVPTLHIPGSSKKFKNTERQARLMKRIQKDIVKDLLKDSSSMAPAFEEPQPGPSSFCNEFLITTNNKEEVGGTKNIKANKINKLKKIPNKNVEKPNLELPTASEISERFNSSKV